MDNLELQLVRAWNRYLEHLAGRHNQKSHANRYGSADAIKGNVKRLGGDKAALKSMAKRARGDKDFQAKVKAGAQAKKYERDNMPASKRLEILENSLAKKQKAFDDKIAAHFDDVKSANGQPLNDKRGGQATINRWEKQNDALRNLKQSIEKTKKAIEIEKSKISAVKRSRGETHQAILDLVDSGNLQQWRKHPNTFFVKGVDKARIVWDNKKGILAHKYTHTIKDPEQWKIFAKTFNELKAKVEKRAA